MARRGRGGVVVPDVDVTEFESPTREKAQAGLRTMFRDAIQVAKRGLLEEAAREVGGAVQWQRVVIEAP